MLIFLGGGSCGGSRLEDVRGYPMLGNKGEKITSGLMVEIYVLTRDQRLMP